MDQYYVIGSPIDHSRSPKLHRQFAEQTGQDMAFDKMEVTTETFARTMAHLKDQRVKGVAVTLPIKSIAYKHVNHADEASHLAKAVSMIAFDEKGKATGYNLDGFGMIQDIKVNHKEDLAGKRILLIGAGGAASGVLGPLLQENPASLTMVNRTAKNAKKLAKRFKDLGDIKLSTYDDLGSDFDVLINATSTSAQGICPPMPDAVFDNHPFCYDLMYGKSQFLAWAKSMGVTRMADGAGMLLELSKQAFYIWRGVKP